MGFGYSDIFTEDSAARFVFLGYTDNRAFSLKMLLIA